MSFPSGMEFVFCVLRRLVAFTIRRYYLPPRFTIIYFTPFPVGESQLLCGCKITHFLISSNLQRDKSFLLVHDNFYKR